MKLKKNPTLSDLQNINNLIYGIVDDRHYDTWNIFSNQERFMMRALKGIRKKDKNKLKDNLAISVSWFLAIMNRFHINLDKIVWKRFPYLCSYCGNCPCVCDKTRPKKRAIISKLTKNKPIFLRNYQKMFEEIYPSKRRNLEHAGIHLAEEQGELSEAIQLYLGSHERKYFKSITDESADYFSCLIGVFNSANIHFEETMLKFYADNCHVCHKIPCACDFMTVAEYKS